MKGNLTIIRSDGSILQTELDLSPALETLQAAVGGYIELIPFFDRYAGSDCIAYCNETGKIDGLPHNAVAQTLWGHTFDNLVGDIAVLTGDDEFMESM